MIDKKEHAMLAVKEQSLHADACKWASFQASLCVLADGMHANINIISLDLMLSARQFPSSQCSGNSFWKRAYEQKQTSEIT